MLEPSVINDIRNERADLWPHSPRFGKEDAQVLRYGCVILQVIVQNRCAAFAWMYAPDWLAQLHLVSQENQIRCRSSLRDELCERDLPGLVDKQIIELSLCLRPAENPGRAANEVRQCLLLKDAGI